MALEIVGPLRVFSESLVVAADFSALTDGPVSVDGIRSVLELAGTGAAAAWEPIVMFDARGKCWRSVRAHPALDGTANDTGGYRVWFVEHRPGADLTDPATEVVLHLAGTLACVAANRSFSDGLMPASFRPCDGITWTPTDYFTNLVTDVGGGARAVSPGSDAGGEFRIVDTFGMSVWFEPVLNGGSPADAIDLLASRLV